MRTPHTSFFKGSPVRIIFKDGTVWIGKFVEKVGKKAIRIQFQDGFIQEARIVDIRSANYYKPLPHELPL